MKNTHQQNHNLQEQNFNPKPPPPETILQSPDLAGELPQRHHHHPTSKTHFCCDILFTLKH